MRPALCLQVGNRAFAGQFAEAVPDGWSILNGLDPVPFVPKVRALETMAVLWRQLWLVLLAH